MAKRDFLYDDGERAEPKEETAAQFLSALKSIGANACAQEERCAVCLNPCPEAAAKPLPSVVQIDKDVREILIAFDGSLKPVIAKRGESIGNIAVMSAGAKLIGVVAGFALKEQEPTEQLAMKLQAAAAIAQLDMTVKVLAKQAIDGIPLIVAMAKTLDRVIRESSAPIAEELKAYHERKNKKQA